MESRLQKTARCRRHLPRTEDKSVEFGYPENPQNLVMPLFSVTYLFNSFLSRKNGLWRFTNSSIFINFLCPSLLFVQAFLFYLLRPLTPDPPWRVHRWVHSCGQNSLFLNSFHPDLLLAYNLLILIFPFLFSVLLPQWFHLGSPSKLILTLDTHTKPFKPLFTFTCAL